MIRLDRYLAESGLGSRESVKRMIRDGRISVKDVSPVRPESKIREDAVVLADGKQVFYRPFHYYMLHKPSGYLTAKSDNKRPTVMEFVKKGPPALSPVGRLDLDTEGLLLLTNDGALSHWLLSPRSNVEKVYYLRTDRPIPDGAAEMLLNPVVFKDFTSKPATLRVLSEREAEITVTEGKYHEVKRLMHAAGCEVVYLKRIAFGPLRLGDLKKGEIRSLSDEETEALLKIRENPGFSGEKIFDRERGGNQ